MEKTKIKIDIWAVYDVKNNNTLFLNNNDIKNLFKEFSVKNMGRKMQTNKGFIWIDFSINN